MSTPLFQAVHFQFEPWEGSSATFRVRTNGYCRWPAAKFSDAPSRLTDRQANFYKNLVNLALALQTDRIPVDMTLPDGTELWMDHGCMKIAEHAGFLEPLQDEENGTVGSVSLAWRVTRP